MERILGSKECNGCHEKGLDWNKDLNKQMGIWRLAQVYKAADGTLVYQTHDCPKFKTNVPKIGHEPVEEPWVRPEKDGYYCPDHNILLVPQTLSGVCSICSEKGLGVNGSPACVFIVC